MSRQSAVVRQSAVALVMLAGCGERGTAKPVEAAPSGPVAEMALQVSDSVAIWFTGGRADTSTDGTPCVERVMEIRAAAKAVPIPLLYTREIPTIVSDSTIEVHIWRHCVPADPYRVNLRTGQPTRIGG